ncbi:unnamed protein product [Phytomonas sp. EM1]|nr:unnamed protein product [Phytomonas sp. EM1]|eukprot:CCW60027.1 unnamed protein product [Phytomonas sp. isolate EM1]
MPPKNKNRKNKTHKPTPSPDTSALAEESFGVGSLPVEDPLDRDAAATISRDASLGQSQRIHSTIFRNSSEGRGAKSRENGDDALDADDNPLVDSILQILLSGTTPVSQAVDTILSVYKQNDPVNALCVVLNLIAKASGVTEVELDADAFTDGIDITSLLEELYVRVPEDANAYFLVNKDPKYRRFRRRFPNLFETLMERAFINDALLDGTLLPTLARWFISMSESKSRSFRHTATVAILGLIQGLNELMTQLQNRNVTTRTKKDVKAIGEKLESLAQWRDHFFSQAIHQRLRDIAAEIRLCAVQYLKEWIWSFPDEFMANKYLRYFGMTLHDPRPELRAECLDMILQGLARLPDAYNRMHLFLQYFASRLVEMCNDIDIRCTELAIRVVAMLVRTDSNASDRSEVLSNEMIDRVLLTLFDERPTIRHAAGVLLKVFIHCRTAAEESEAEQVEAATELLCSFVRTLRTQHQERMPEKYLVDALWNPEQPPLILTSYEPILKQVKASASPLDLVVCVRLLTSLIQKINGKLELGPAPKDDRRNANHAKRANASAQKKVDDLVRNVSEGLGLALCGVMAKQRGNPEVLCAVADSVPALDLSIFTSRQQVSTLSDFMLELRKATTTVVLPTVIFGLDSTHDALVRAWHALAFSVSPLQSIAQGHLQEILSQIVKQLVQVENAFSSTTKHHFKREEELIHIWGRFSLIASLIPTADHWDSIKKALLGQVHQDTTVNIAWLRLSAFVIDAAMNSLLSQINNEQQTEGVISAMPISERISDLVGFLLQTLAITTEGLAHQDNSGSSPQDSSGTQHDEGSALLSVRSLSLHLRVRALGYLFDMVALSYYDVPLNEQYTLVKRFEEVFEVLCTQLRDAQEHLKAITNAYKSDKCVVSRIAEARHQCTHIEATQMHLVVGLCRLFLFKRLGVGLAPRVLTQWTHSSSKSVSDIFKSLFNVLRNMAGGSFEIERDILVEAYNRCAEVGATPISVDALYQMGSKLASMHFFAADRYYASCKHLVQFAIDFAITTDPLILQAVIPYCSKLRVVDAIQLLQHDLPKGGDLFTNSVNTYVRAFLSSLHRAAKLEDAPLPASSTTVKRPREVTLQQHDDEDLLEIIAQGLPTVGVPDHSNDVQDSASQRPRRPGSFARTSASSHHGKISISSRMVNRDGWHVPAGSQNSQESEGVFVALSPDDQQRVAPGDHHRHRSVVNVPTTQEIATPSLSGGVDTEVFIATREFE